MSLTTTRIVCSSLCLTKPHSNKKKTPPSLTVSSSFSFSSFSFAHCKRHSLSIINNNNVVVRAAVVKDDHVTMFFQAEGTMNEAAIPTVTNALKGAEGINNLKVQIVEGIASVELTKETTRLAPGVASGLVEIIRGSGFTLQTLNLGFEDEEEEEEEEPIKEIS